MIKAIFISDLHGHTDRYEKLFARIREKRPAIVLFGGDLLPHGMHRNLYDNFTEDFLFRSFEKLRTELGEDYPQVFLILGNDDPRSEEQKFIELGESGAWTYLHNRKVICHGYTFFGYANIPPTPFRFKDWERFDVSRYVDPGCSPPYKTNLDRAALDGIIYDHVPLDVHVGSIAIFRFIEEKQPWLTLHGHIHESSRITGHWRQELGRTQAFSAAWDGPDLALVEFDLDDPSNAQRYII
jgi:Icc-related predicted phosphoesterase